MKKVLLSICSLALLSLFLISCNKENIQPNKKEGAVEFGFSLNAPSKSGTLKSSTQAAAVPAAIVVSIKSGNGNLAYNTQKVDLYNMNGYYISKPLSLLPGNYTLEQFLVVDASGNIIYASPIQGSAKAYLVNLPLPISFIVSKDNVTKVVPEVLGTEGSTPEDFGYSTFSFEVVKTFDFLISVFIYNESSTNFEMTTANLSIIASSKTIFTNTLDAITNKVTLADGYDSFILTVTKDGYKTWTNTLTAAELKLYFRSEDKGPLEVILEKGETITKIKYGRLYNGFTVIDVRGIAPVGWHIPSYAECTTLTNSLGGLSVAGGKLKDVGGEYWKSGLGTNESGFTGRGGGIRDYGSGNYSLITEYGYWWTSTAYVSSPLTAYSFYLVSSGNMVVWSATHMKYGNSIRCIKDTSDWTEGETVKDIDGNVYAVVKIGSQVWMVSNLIVTKYRNGDIIPAVTDNTAWATLTTGAWCSYNNDPSNI